MLLPLITPAVILDAEVMAGYVRFRVSGAYNLPDFESLIHVMHAECGRHLFDKAFIDLTRLDGDIPDMDRFKLALLFAEVWGGRMSAAIFVDPARQRINKLFETAAVNRSARVQVGFVPEALVTWLTAG